VRFGYDGTVFYGWARQPGFPTVEGEIRRWLTPKRGPRSEPVTSLAVASRTDRGVSARANALVLEHHLPGPTLLRALNGIHPSIYFTAATPVASDFRVRRPVRRTYRYFEARPLQNPRRVKDAAARFSGEVDVRSLGRAISQADRVFRTIESVTISKVRGGTRIEVRAPSFVWGMVRKIVAALREIDSGRLSVERLQSALDGSTRLTLPTAEPEPLLLWEVEYPIPWMVHWTGPNRAQAAELARKAARLWAGSRVIDSLVPETRDSGR